MMPVLAFYQKAEGWAIKNVGQGPAMNVMFYNFDNKNMLVNKILLYPVSKDEEVLFANRQVFRGANTLGTVYKDASGKVTYRTRMEGHGFTFSEKSLFDEHKDAQHETESNYTEHIRRS